MVQRIGMKWNEHISEQVEYYGFLSAQRCRFRQVVLSETLGQLAASLGGWSGARVAEDQAVEMKSMRCQHVFSWSLSVSKCLILFLVLMSSLNISK